jgi:exonuclease VII small subunit
MFAKLCGDGAAKNVVLATTMWGNVKPEVGEKREDELKSKYWAGMLELGSQAMHFKDSPASAWNIIDTAIKSNEDPTLLIQEELVDLKRRLSETEAGKALYKRLQKSLAEQKESIRKLRDQAQVEENEELAEELTAQYEAMQDILQTTFDQMSKMKIPLGRRLKMLTSFRKPRLVSSQSFLVWRPLELPLEGADRWRPMID